MTLRERRQKILVDMKELNASIEKDGRDSFNKDEEEKFNSLKADLERVNASIEREAFIKEQSSLAKEDDYKLEDLKTSAGSNISDSKNLDSVRPGGDPAKKDFETVADFLATVIKNPNDQRLSGLWNDGARAEQSMGTGAKGGFAIPKQFRNDLMRQMPQGPSIRDKATVIPAGSPPDSEITMPALDQDSSSSNTNNMYGGVQVVWVEEGGTKTETDANFKEISLKPREVAAYIVATDKLLRNWQASSMILEQLLLDARRAAEDSAFISGDGIGKPLGIRNSGALKSVTRNTSSQILFADIKAMEAVFDNSGSDQIIYTSRGAYSEFLDMTGDGGGATNVIRIDSETGARYVYGKQLAIAPRGMAALGSLGDVLMIDRSKYLIKDGSGPYVAVSEHVHFTSNKTVIKMFWNVDGQPWLEEVIRDENDDEYSPFVAIAA